MIFQNNKLHKTFHLTIPDIFPYPNFSRISISAWISGLRLLLIFHIIFEKTIGICKKHSDAESFVEIKREYYLNDTLKAL